MTTAPEPVDIPDWLWRVMVMASVFVVVFSIVVTIYTLGAAT